METYFSTFIPGTGEIVSDLLRKKLGKVGIKLKLDGLILFETPAPFQLIKDLRFCNNTFALLKTDKDIDVSDFIDFIASDRFVQKRLKDFILPKTKTFRVVYSKENKLVNLDNGLTGRLEVFINRGTNLKVDKRDPDVEFWILERSEGNIFFGTRVTKKQNTKDILEQGELRTEVVNILCELSEPDESDVFLDPFAGSGAIPIERARIYRFKNIFAGENDKAIYTSLVKKIKTLGLKIVVGKWNATKLGALTDGSIYKIVTDPPWGQFGQYSDIEDLYKRSFGEFYRLLRKNGVLVLLTSQKELVDEILEEYQDKFLLEKEFNVLVSGKKAVIFKIRKI